MQIHKFGGASVKDAASIKRLVTTLKKVGYTNTVIVISAMGKTTNALERVVDCYFNSNDELLSVIQEVKKYHNTILLDLFEDSSAPIYKEVGTIFNDLQLFLSTNKSPNYNFVYDQVVSFGELLSTKIISAYLTVNAIENNWLDARVLLKTDAYYRNASIEWKKTKANITAAITTSTLYLTQGFIASDTNNFTTTLGREGSDYTAAILAYCLNANVVTIWKDVPGVLNADPRYFENAQLLQQISYTEAIELAFYGATVIHPKTLQPLQHKEIPLYVKSFLKPEKEGTKVSKAQKIIPEIPCFILKKNQILITLSSLDFSYIVEENISYIFNLLHTYKMKVDVIQNSAISFSVCVEDKYSNLQPLLQRLRETLKVVYYENVSLYTVRHYTPKSILQIEKGKTILLKQVTETTLQIITK